MAEPTNSPDAPQTAAQSVPPTDAPATKTVDKFKMPEVIRSSEDYERTFAYLKSRYHLLTPVASFSGMAPQHGLVVAKVMISPDPADGEVYQDKLFCKTGSRNQDDDEVAITKVGLRKLALAAGLNLSAEILLAEQNHWIVRGNCQFLGLDGSVQSFSATEEYDLRDGSPQVRKNASEAEKRMARSHGLRGAESRALNAACREYGIRQKYTRGELKKAFVLMRMMFIPDASNEVQMRLVTQQALAGVSRMFPQPSLTTPPSLEPIQGLPAQGTPMPPWQDEPIDTHTVEDDRADVSDDGAPDGVTRIQKIIETQKERKAPKTGKFTKWTVVDAEGVEYVTIKSDIAKAAEALWNKSDWTKGRLVEIQFRRNNWNENEIEEILPC
jgi:hypothetical protein